MESATDYLLLLLLIGGPISIALKVRRMMPHRERLGAWIVVGTVIVSMIGSMVVLHWRHEVMERERIERAIKSLPHASPR